jgi:hypothetical protein
MVIIGLGLVPMKNWRSFGEARQPADRRPTTAPDTPRESVLTGARG